MSDVSLGTRPRNSLVVDKNVKKPNKQSIERVSFLKSDTISSNSVGKLDVFEYACTNVTKIRKNNPVL